MGDGFNCKDIDECTDDPTLCENGVCLNDQVIKIFQHISYLRMYFSVSRVRFPANAKWATCIQILPILNSVSTSTNVHCLTTSVSMESARTLMVFSGKILVLK